MSALGPSLFQSLKSSRGVMKWLKPVADRYASLAGYRKMGLKYDDILIEENGTVQKALTRLSERDSYDRAYRHRVAHQLAIEHRDLPKEQWLNPKEDVRYLQPLVKEVEAENSERAAWNAVKVEKRRHH